MYILFYNVVFVDFNIVMFFFGNVFWLHKHRFENDTPCILY